MIKSSTFEDTRQKKLLDLLVRDAYRYGEFKLSSGRTSSHYVNCKPVSLSGIGLNLLSLALLEHVDTDAVAVAGLTLGADPLVSGVAMAAAQCNRNLDGIIVRKEAKGHGTAAWLEGPIPNPGDKITVLEDVVTTGASSMKAVRLLREAGFVISKVVAIVDRQEGAELILNKEELDLISLFTLSDIANKSAVINQ